MSGTSLGDAIKRARRRAGFTSYAKLAEAMGITEKTAGRWERNEARPQPSHWAELRRRFPEIPPELYGQPDPGETPWTAQIETRLGLVEEELRAVRGALARLEGLLLDR